uniref:Uncharacterized protein n=1 Tax=Lepeophtheirus salmonis TaxID=72036 RepID=A0A0K2TUF5_LEPSM
MGYQIGDTINLRSNGSELFNATNNPIEPRILIFPHQKPPLDTYF